MYVRKRENDGLISRAIVLFNPLCFLEFWGLCFFELGLLCFLEPGMFKELPGFVLDFSTTSLFCDHWIPCWTPTNVTKLVEEETYREIRPQSSLALSSHYFIAEVLKRPQISAYWVSQNLTEENLVNLIFVGIQMCSSPNKLEHMFNILGEKTSRQTRNLCMLSSSHSVHAFTRYMCNRNWGATINIR